MRVLRRWTGDQRGAALVWVSIFVLAFVAFMGIALDTGRAYVYRARVQAAVDAAALAAAQDAQVTLTMDAHGTIFDQAVFIEPQTAQADAQATFAANMAWSLNPAARVTPGQFTVTVTGSRVQVVAEFTMDTMFMRAIGSAFKTLPVNARATAVVVY